METPAETFTRAASFSVIGCIAVCLWTNSFWPVLVTGGLLVVLAQMCSSFEQ